MSINRNNIYMHLIEKQFNMIEKTALDAIVERDWANKWTMTKYQLEQFENYAIPLLKKVFKCNKKKAVSIFEWFRVVHGVAIKN